MFIYHKNNIWWIILHESTSHVPIWINSVPCEYSSSSWNKNKARRKATQTSNPRSNSSKASSSCCCCCSPSLLLLHLGSSKGFCYDICIVAGLDGLVEASLVIELPLFWITQHPISLTDLLELFQMHLFLGFFSQRMSVRVMYKSSFP